jgi:hypothetical protein
LGDPSLVDGIQGAGSSQKLTDPGCSITDDIEGREISSTTSNET